MTSTFEGDSSRTLIASELALPPQVAGVLGSGGLELISSAMRPYALQARVGPSSVRVRGESLAVDLFAKLLQRLAASVSGGKALSPTDMADIVHDFLDNQLKFDLAFRLKGVPHAVRPLNLTQVAFMNAMLADRHELIFGIGPTGTGKTHLALAAGLALLATGKVQHLVITRPSVLWEGETMTATRRADIVDAGQLTAVEDELHQLVGYEGSRRLIVDGQLELVPLGCLRGRTFNNSFILVDEAQNLLAHQMRMVLTRLGRDSRLVMLGDPDQVDLLGDELSGLPDILRRLEGSDLALVHQFRRGEIVRNPLVAEIEALYDDGTAMPIRRAA
jgi:phosphate starvation-inducible PhoH-like protein